MNPLRGDNLHEDVKQETHVALKLAPPATPLGCHVNPQRRRRLYRQPIGRLSPLLLLP